MTPNVRSLGLEVAFGVQVVGVHQSREEHAEEQLGCKRVGQGVFWYRNGVGGDEIRGKKITGLGKEFVKFIRDDEACAYALQPGRDYRIRMQYAYFN